MKKFFNHRFMTNVWITCAFGAGFALCLSLRGLLEKSSWAESLSAIATICALFLAVITYRGWQQQKIREDAYQTKRLYISTLVLIETTMVELYNLLYNIVPEPGMLVLSDEQAKKTLENIVEKHNEMRFHAQALATIRSELNFWGVSLAKESEDDHNNLIDTTNEYLSALHYLHNSLTNMYIHKISDNSISQWKLRVTNKSIELHELFKSRKTKNMSSVFKH